MISDNSDYNLANKDCLVSVVARAPFLRLYGFVLCVWCEKPAPIPNVSFVPTWIVLHSGLQFNMMYFISIIFVIMEKRLSKDNHVFTIEVIMLMRPIYVELAPGVHFNNIDETFVCWIGHIDCLVQDCSNSSVLAMELLQSCTKPSI